MNYPLFGIRVSGDSEVITSGYASQGGYLAHNVFLDYGRYAGIPCILLLAFFFFRPVIQMFKSGRLTQYMPFILAHFAMFIFWMSLSFQFYKTFWALWMLMTLAIAHASPAPRRENSPALVRRPGANPGGQSVSPSPTSWKQV
jgi:O-antigen ligase